MIRRCVVLLFCFASFLAHAHHTALHDREESDPAPAGGEYWAGPALSGSWFDPARNGEGFVLEVLADGSAVVVWFTYPAAGEPGEQAWLIGQGGRLAGNRIRFDLVTRTRGGVWGDAFAPARIENVPWGTLEFEFHSCTSATVRYAGTPAYGSGTFELTRLTELDELRCDGARATTPNGARSLAGLRSKSGPWFVATRSGEGWFVEELAGGVTVVYWFTYDPQGNQAWTVGAGVRDGERLVVDQQTITRGTRFGSGFDPAAVQRTRWGSIEFTFTECNKADFRYASVLPGYDANARTATRLGMLASAPCIDGTPQLRRSGTWTEVAATPAPAQSEHAATTLDGKIYALGGYGDGNGFKRYDPAANQWTELPDLPSGRHHLAAFAIDGGVYFVGGDAIGSAGQDVAAYRYDVATSAWEPRPEMSFTFGSQAAVMHGRAYVGAGDGSVEEYDPRARIKRRIEAPNLTERDHAQVVAFLGELWVIGGRSPETDTVAIYDPAAQRWRAGPRMGNTRGGFAAAVVGDQIVVGGGELINITPFRLEPTVEVIVAGGDRWAFAPNLPVPVHGVAGAAANGRFYAISGSTNAGSRFGATGRVFAIELVP